MASCIIFLAGSMRCCLLALRRLYSSLPSGSGNLYSRPSRGKIPAPSTLLAETKLIVVRQRGPREFGIFTELALASQTWEPLWPFTCCCLGNIDILNFSKLIATALKAQCKLTCIGPCYCTPPSSWFLLSGIQHCTIASWAPSSTTVLIGFNRTWIIERLLLGSSFSSLWGGRRLPKTDLVAAQQKDRLKTKNTSKGSSVYTWKVDLRMTGRTIGSFYHCRHCCFIAFLLTHSFALCCLCYHDLTFLPTSRDWFLMPRPSLQLCATPPASTLMHEISLFNLAPICWGAPHPQHSPTEGKNIHSLFFCSIHPWILVGHFGSTVVRNGLPFSVHLTHSQCSKWGTLS